MTTSQAGREKKAAAQEGQGETEKKMKDTKGKADVNGEFFSRLGKILKIVIPGFTSKEFLMLVVHSVFLVLRTWLSVIVANLDGFLVKTLVTADGKGFVRGLGMWFGISIPAIFTNSMVCFIYIFFPSRVTLCPPFFSMPFWMGMRTLSSFLLF